MTTLADVADDWAHCWWCGGSDLHSDGPYTDCRECGSSFKFSRKLGSITDKTPPYDLDMVRTLVLSLRDT